MKSLITTAIMAVLLSTQSVKAEETFNHPEIKKHNRVRLLAGQGVTRYKHTRIGTFNTIEPQNGFVYGIGFDTPISKNLFVGAEMTSNNNALLSVGIDL